MTRKTKPVASKKGSQRKERPAAELDALIKEATIDANDESEATTGFYTMFEEHLAVPFKTDVLGVEVTVTEVTMTDDERIVSVCERGKASQRISIIDLPLPDPPPRGSEWIDAYRRWARGK